jgi:hypothetical protein
VVLAKAPYTYCIIFLDLRIYLHFRYETSIPMHVLILVLALEGNLCVLQIACGALRCSSSSSARDSSLMPRSVHPLHQLEVVDACSLCVAFECRSFLEVILR